MVMHGIAKRFGYGAGGTAMFFFFPYVMLPVLAFSKPVISAQNGQRSGQQAPIARTGNANQSQAAFAPPVTDPFFASKPADTPQAAPANPFGNANANAPTWSSWATSATPATPTTPPATAPSSAPASAAPAFATAVPSPTPAPTFLTPTPTPAPATTAANPFVPSAPAQTIGEAPISFIGTPGGQTNPFGQQVADAQNGNSTFKAPGA